MILRPALAEESAALAAILTAWAAQTDWLPKLHSAEEDRVFMAGLVATGQVTLAEDLTGPVGFLGREGNEVNHLFVAHAARRQGVGRCLLDQAKSAQPVLRLWCFQANTGARAFYAREGFVEIDRTDGRRNDESLPDVRLEWRRA